MKKKFSLTLASAICIAGCASQPPINVQTASGQPEGIFRNTNIAHVQSLIADRCLNHHKTIDDQSPMQITCSEQIPVGTQSVAAVLLVGGDSMGSPFIKFRYTTIQRGSDVRVVVNTWLQNPNPPGPDNKVAFMPNSMHNNLQTVLIELGADQGTIQSADTKPQTPAAKPSQPSDTEAMNTELRRLASDSQAQGDSKAAKEYLDMIVPASSQH